MGNYKLIGKDYTPPDLVAKVTGAAKYAEDFHADGMLYCRLLRSPMPHARVRSIDTSEAARMPGVRAILTADDLPATPVPQPPRSGGPPAVDEHGQPVIEVMMRPEPALTNEPLYEGEPILAVAAVDEATAVAAIETIRIKYEPLPFVVDPLESLRPGGPNARPEGNVFRSGRIGTVKWEDEDFAELADGHMPMGQISKADTWSFGDVDAGFKAATVVIDESFNIPTTSHIPLETRSALAYWQNGKLYVHCSVQSLAQSVVAMARMMGMKPADVILISEYTGGAFGGKNPAYVQLMIPALLAKKAGQPVMMRITRDDETAIGRNRPGMIGRAKAGFAADGRMLALDLFLVGDAGPYGRSDHGGGGRFAAVLYQPKAMRFRGIGVFTNTSPRGAQRGPGVQFAPTVELVISKAARRLGIDQVAIRRINSPNGQAPSGPPQADGSQRYLTGANVQQALDKGAEMFHWAERKQRSGTRVGSKVRGVGVGVGTYSAGSVGFDGLLLIKPDGKLYIQSGCGNLGTLSNYDTTRAAAEVLGMSWEKVVITQGDSSKHLPWSCSQGGSQTTHAHTRANWAAGLDAKRKLQEIAARDLGGRPDDYEVGNERVYRKGSPGTGLSFARAASRAIQLGGRFDGHELASDLNEMTERSARALAGLGLIGVARDNFPREGDTMSFIAGFAEVEVDVETGESAVVDYALVADVGTVVHPRICQGQAFGASMLGFAHALHHKWVYDTRYGLALNRRFYQNKPPSILDAPRFQFAALGIPDPQTPVGARGIGEPPVGAGYAAVVNALIDAIGEDAFRRSPVTADMILTSREAGGRYAQDSLVSHI